MAIQVRSFESFAAVVAREMDLAAMPERTDRLRVELSFDSLALFELYVVLSELGAEIQPEVLANPDVTIGDLHDRVTLAVVEGDIAQKMRPPW